MKVSDQNKIEKHAQVITNGMEYLTKMAKGKYYDDAQEARYWAVGLQLVDRIRETLTEMEKIGQIYADESASK